MKRRILIIEAHDPTLFLLTFILERDGCEVHAARGGPDALDLAQRTNPALVLIGRTVTDADRLDVACRLRDEPSLAHIPVVAVVDTPQDGRVAVREGCTGWVEAPILPARLRAQLAAYLDGTAGAAPQHAASAGASAASA